MDRYEQVEQLMEAFAERTGLVGQRRPRRYLWTDAFAVCNYLELHRALGNDRFLDRATRLVTQVHDVLGAYAANDSRRGWLGGMDDGQHRRTPTRAGLRIGKSLPERSPAEPLDEQREWDRDGQYFHYLTRWMHALERVAETTGEAHYHRWAAELALGAFNGFVKHPAATGSARMVWKMSVDLDRPLVASMGHHDPLDGWITAQALAASTHADGHEQRELRAQVSVYRNMFAFRDLATADALGIGGLLVDAWRLFRIAPEMPDSKHGEVAALIDAAAVGLDHLTGRGELDAPPSHRLAFREVGLGIGVRAAQRLFEAARTRQPDPLLASLDRVVRSLPMADRIERVWLQPEHRRVPVWIDHRDINDVMLATSLAPDGYLGPAPGSDAYTEAPP